MSDVFSAAKRSQVMSRIRSSGNRETELEMIRIFRRHGITGWRRGRVIKINTQAGFVHTRPDFVFASHSVVVFVDGEFWHGHPTRCQIPATRRLWWLTKINSNRKRDRLQNRSLRQSGWIVIRVWQHELKTSAVLRKLKLGGLL